MFGVGSGNDSASGECSDRVGLRVHESAAQRDTELTISTGVEPAHGSGVPVPRHPFEFADDGERALGGCAADGRGGVKRGRQGEQRCIVCQSTGDVGGQVLNVREFEHGGVLRDVHVGAVRCQGLGDRPHSVGVLGEVLVAGEQSLGQAVVFFGVSTASHRPGEDATGDEVAGAAHQKFRRRTDEVRDVERPACRVVTGEVVQDAAHVEFAVDVRDDVAGENNLVELAGVDALDSTSDGLLPLRSAQRAFTPVHGDVAPGGD